MAKLAALCRAPRAALRPGAPWHRQRHRRARVPCGRPPLAPIPPRNHEHVPLIARRPRSEAM